MGSSTRLALIVAVVLVLNLFPAACKTKGNVTPPKKASSNTSLGDNITVSDLELDSETNAFFNTAATRYGNSRFFACLLLYYQKNENDSAAIEALVGKDKSQREKRAAKISAMILNKCRNTITDAVINEVLIRPLTVVKTLESEEDTLLPRYAKYVDADFGVTKTATFNWTLDDDEKEALERLAMVCPLPRLGL